MTAKVFTKQLYRPSEDSPTNVTINTIYTADEIRRRVSEMGNQISTELHNWERPVIIGVLKGAMIFLGDLLRSINCQDPLQLEFVRLSSYGAATESSGHIQAPYLDLPNIAHRNILVVEDIIDSGYTAQFFMNYLKGQFAPKTLRLAVLLDKPKRRRVPVAADYVGFTIEDLFVVGYGLDYAEQFRELPYLGQLCLPDQ